MDDYEENYKPHEEKHVKITKSTIDRKKNETDKSAFCGKDKSSQPQRERNSRTVAVTVECVKVR